VLGYPDMIPALSNAAIDGAVMIEPTLSAAVSRGIVTPWEAGRTGPAYGGSYQAAVLYYSDRFIAQADLARRFMVAYLQGVRAYNDAFVKGEGRAEAVRVLTEETPIKDPALYDQMQMAGLDPDGRLVRASMQLELDFFRGRGYYTGGATVESAIDPSFAEYAARQLGPYR
jgi:NitT/TauT family transport system substrate-binding protein